MPAIFEFFYEKTLSFGILEARDARVKQPFRRRALRTYQNRIPILQHLAANPAKLAVCPLYILQAIITK